MVSGVWVMNQKKSFEAFYSAVRHTVPLSQESVRSWMRFEATATVTFPFIFYILVLSGCLVVTYTNVIAFSVTIFRTLQKSRQKMTPKTVLLHTRLTKALIYQALFPVFLLLLPLVTVFAAVICNMDARIAGPIMAMTITWQPVANALCIVAFVNPIHRFLLRSIGLGHLFSQKTIHLSLRPISHIGHFEVVASKTLRISGVS
ncbi:hypothetical protein L596_024438 [Steinernema carpocapsae]|nr:hypothetical protein L596_024438 [Steinernema carpocapsae]